MGRNLSPAETTALVAFLETLHPAGQAPARDASNGRPGTGDRPGHPTMATEPTIAAMGVDATLPARSYAALADYWALTKPEVNFLIAVTTSAGFYLGLSSLISHHFPFALLIHTLLGTLLVASGAGTLNQFVEWRFDARMRRTARGHYLPDGCEPASALHFGFFLSLAGAIYLAVAVNVLASLLAVLALVTYLFLYTPLKRIDTAMYDWSEPFRALCPRSLVGLPHRGI